MHTLLSPAIQSALGGGSAIRRMFEAGIELKQKYGADNVYDFSLGNPDLAPPPAVKAALADIAATADQPFAFGYMPNAGFPSTRAAFARLVSREQGVETTPDALLATVGAAGGLNVFFHAVLSPGDEVLVPSPYFVEYGAYCANHGGVLVPVPTHPDDFSLDLDAIAAAITPKTRAIIINTPNNPTGQIYPAEDLAALGRILEVASVRHGRTIYMLSDEPYRALNYTGEPLPSMFKAYSHSVVVGSFSKTLCLAGERIGYVAPNPGMEGVGDLMAGLILANRTLGFVNAPNIGQRIAEAAIDAAVDLPTYRRRRDKLAAILTAAGIEFFLPKGAFYFFAKTPTADESVFIDALLRQRILAVAGTGFGLGGHMRLAFCVEDATIENSAPGFLEAMREFR